MKHFKLLNSVTGKQFVVTEEGKNLTMKDKKLGKICTVIGEVNEAGEIMSGKIGPNENAVKNEDLNSGSLSKDKKVVVEPNKKKTANGKNANETE